MKKHRNRLLWFFDKWQNDKIAKQRCALYQGRTNAIPDTLPLAIRSLFASLKSEGKATVTPKSSAGETALVEGWHTSRSCKAILSLNAVAPMWLQRAISIAASWARTASVIWASFFSFVFPHENHGEYGQCKDDDEYDEGRGVHILSLFVLLEELRIEN